MNMQTLVCYFDNKNQVAHREGHISLKLYESLRDIIHSYDNSDSELNDILKKYS